MTITLSLCFITHTSPHYLGWKRDMEIKEALSTATSTIAAADVAMTDSISATGVLCLLWNCDRTDPLSLQRRVHSIFIIQTNVWITCWTAPTLLSPGNKLNSISKLNKTFASNSNYTNYLPLPFSILQIVLCLNSDKSTPPNL